MENSEAEAKKKSNKKYYLVFSVVILIVLGVIAYVTVYFQKHVTTNDAQVDGYIIPVIARVEAFLDSVYVVENEKVVAGQLVATLDSIPYILALEINQGKYDEARIQLKISENELVNKKIQLREAQHEYRAKQAQFKKAMQDYSENEQLYAEGVIPLSEYDKYRAAFVSSREVLDIAKEQIEKLKVEIIVNEEQIEKNISTVSKLKSNVDLSARNLSYTKIYSPIDGTISQVKIRTGQYMKGGETLFTVVDDENIWVTANYKETKIHKLVIGGKIKISIDAYPSRTFWGTINSMGPAAIARYSFLPPNNTTGNFVKIVQRVPVRIYFEDTTDLSIMKPGLNVETTYTVK
ncbi:HlyD family secretion protein [Aureibacter tunicatorum]|uniref:Membrane fusion protein (Multidrug efflux system) n=1 Tax=Aureibacter tunicatorum TaxID=866807 RepID=A0AAE3XMJ3_9BACT|nr:HlyD family secretion protein [Aureibacter tunicatorum]MDR6239240.1 membrane fusion protein (multidrug efflux system) [Aureibacter tunicatorum]